MGLFDGIRRQWHEIKSTKMIKRFGKILLLGPEFDTNRAYVYEKMGERFFCLTEYADEWANELELNRNELLIMMENFEEAIKIMPNSRGSLWEAWRAGKEPCPPQAFHGEEVIKDFGRIVRQGTKDRFIETRVVLVQTIKAEKLLFVSRHDSSSGNFTMSFSESDAVSMLSVFKNALTFM